TPDVPVDPMPVDAHPVGGFAGKRRPNVSIELFHAVLLGYMETQRPRMGSLPHAGRCGWPAGWQVPRACGFPQFVVAIQDHAEVGALSCQRDVSTPMPAITAGRSLSPRSCTRASNRVPCGSPAQRADG